MPRPLSFSTTPYDAEAAAAAILESAQPVATPPSTKPPAVAPVFFSPTPNATPVPLKHKLPIAAATAAATAATTVATVATHRQNNPAWSPQPPLATSLPHHPNRPTASPPLSSPPVTQTPGAADRLPFTPPGRPLETPSAIFGSLAVPTRTPFAASTPAVTRSLAPAAIPLTFSAANTPLPQAAQTPRTPASQPTPPTPSQPNPSVVKSFFRQRSAHLSSPIFRPLRRRISANLSDPVVLVAPLADDKASCPPSISPVLSRRIAFSLNDAFGADPEPISIDLGFRAARVPLLHALTLSFVDDECAIRPIAVRLERDLDFQASMFLSVVRSEFTVPDELLTGSTTVEHAGEEDEEQEVIDIETVRNYLCTSPLTFWAAPENNVANGTARLVLTVTDSDYVDHELFIEVHADPVAAKISVQGPGETARHVDKAETTVFFGQRDDFAQKTVTVWNETGGDAPVLLNVVIEDSAGSSFCIARPHSRASNCVPLLIPAGQSATFSARFTLQPDVSVRKMYYGSVLIKFAAVLPSAEAPGTDLELDQFYDHVINLKAGFPAYGELEQPDEWTPMRPSAKRVLLRDEDACRCSYDDTYGHETPNNVSVQDVVTPLPSKRLQAVLDDTGPPRRSEVSYDIARELSRFSLHLDATPEAAQVTPISNSHMAMEATYSVQAEPKWSPSVAATDLAASEPGNTALELLSHEAAKQQDLEILNTSQTVSGSDGSGAGSEAAAKPPKLRLPRSVRERGIRLPANSGSVELRLQNASDTMVEVSARTRSQRAVSVSPNYLVVKAGEKSVITLLRESANAADETVVLACATMTSPRLTTMYEIPMVVDPAVAHVKQQSDPVSVDRPTVSFYNPGSALRDSRVRILNGTVFTSEFRVWVGDENGPVLNDEGNPVFSIVKSQRGVIAPDEIVEVMVRFDGGEFAAHFTDTLHISVGQQYDVMSLFGYNGSCDMQFSSTKDGFVCVRNDGERCGFVLITGPECEEDSERAVLRPGEQVELPAVHGSGSVIYTGDEIARSRARYANKLSGRDDGSEECVGKSFSGYYNGEDEADTVEGYVWVNEDRHSMHYAGRLLDGNIRRFVFDLDADQGDGAQFAEEKHVVGPGWTACVDDDDGFVHIENMHMDRELVFEVLGAEPRHGVVPPLGDAKVGAFRENVEVRAGGSVQHVRVDLSACRAQRRER